MRDRCCTRFDLKIALPRHVHALTMFARPPACARVPLLAAGRFLPRLLLRDTIPWVHTFPLPPGRTFLSTCPPTLGRFYLARSVKRLLQVGQNWKVELRISFRSFRVIQPARVRARAFSAHDLSTFSFPVLSRIHQARFDPRESHSVREIIKR